MEFVCSTCHVFQAQLFDTSPHKTAFAAMSLPACVTCHSNHRIQHPSDAMGGTSSGSVCLTCHSQGDNGYEAAGKMNERLAHLNREIERADEILKRAELSGMEVGESQLALTQAKDALTKARVTIHTFRLKQVEADIDPGIKVAAAAYAAGEAAMREKNLRRIGLGVSLITIVMVLIGLRLFLRRLEAPAEAEGHQV